MSVDFDAPDLAERTAVLPREAFDALSFGVLQLDCEGTILAVNATERARAGAMKLPLEGRNFYAIMPAGATDMRDRIARAHEAGPVDLEFGWKGDYADVRRELHLRVQSSRDGGLWVFVQR